MNDKNFSYEAAKAELEEILNELEQGETGIDELAKHVKRASELIRLCREKLRQTDEEVKAVLNSFSKDAEE